MECRKEHDQLAVITEPTKFIDGVGMVAQEAFEIEKPDGCVRRQLWYGLYS